MERIEVELVNSGLDNASGEVRAAALKSLLFICLENKEKAKEKVGIFVDFVNNNFQDPEEEDAETDSEEVIIMVRKTALSCLFDLCVYYGLEEMELGYQSYLNDGDDEDDDAGNNDSEIYSSKLLKEKVEQTSKSSHTVIKSLLQFLDYDGDSNYRKQLKESAPNRHQMDDDDDDDDEEGLESQKVSESLRTMSVEGLAKLYLLQSFDTTHPYFNRILLQMILLFHSPDTAQQYTVRQCLSVFFSSFFSVTCNSAATSTASFIQLQKDNIESLQKLFIPIIRLLSQTREGKNSKLRSSKAIEDIKLQMIGNSILEMTQLSTDSKANAELNEFRSVIHQRISLAIVDELLGKYDSKYISDYSSSDIKTMVQLLTNCSISNAPDSHFDALKAKIKELLNTDVIRDKATINLLTKFLNSLGGTKPSNSDLNDENEDVESKPKQTKATGRGTKAAAPKKVKEKQTVFDKLAKDMKNLSLSEKSNRKPLKAKN